MGRIAGGHYLRNPQPAREPGLTSRRGRSAPNGTATSTVLQPGSPLTHFGLESRGHETGDRATTRTTGFQAAELKKWIILQGNSLKVLIVLL
jgi:hypothetical protein